MRESITYTLLNTRNQFKSCFVPKYINVSAQTECLIERRHSIRFAGTRNFPSIPCTLFAQNRARYYSRLHTQHTRVCVVNFDTQSKHFECGYVHGLLNGTELLAFAYLSFVALPFLYIVCVCAVP